VSKAISVLSPRAIDGLGAAALVCVLGVAYWVGVHPALDSRAVAERQRHTLLAETATAEAASQELRTARETLAALTAQAARFTPLEPALRINSRLTRLSDLAQSAEITIGQLTPSAATPEPAKRFTSVPIKVSGSGGFANCVNFLSALQEAHRDIKVSAITLTIAEPASENQAARLDMTLDLVWYAAPDDRAGAR